MRFLSRGSQAPQFIPSQVSFRVTLLLVSGIHHSPVSRLDLHESKDSDVVTATFELPGLTPENVTIDVDHNRLTVSGESGTSSSHEDSGWTVHERRYGKFPRALQLPLGTKVGPLYMDHVEHRC